MTAAPSAAANLYSCRQIIKSIQMKFYLIIDISLNHWILDISVYVALSLAKVLAVQ